MKLEALPDTTDTTGDSAFPVADTENPAAVAPVATFPKASMVVIVHVTFIPEDTELGEHSSVPTVTPASTPPASTVTSDDMVVERYVTAAVAVPTTAVE